jgi:uncharacterized protein (TIGR02270 family)
MVSDNPASLFVTTLLALERHSAAHIGDVLAIAEAVPAVESGFLSALGWVAPNSLGGTIKSWLISESPFSQYAALECCAAQRVDPGFANHHWTRSPSPRVRASAIRGGGLLGKQDLVVICTAASEDGDPALRFWAAWSAVLLGGRQRALDALVRTGFGESPHRERAFRLALQAMAPADAHKALQQLGGKPDQLRRLIQGSGINGDPTYVGWLIKHMSDDKTARLAGEAFSLITGTDLALLDLERKPPENIEAGPNDNPDDENVEMDPDDGLPWPDAGRITGWWEKNGSRFQPGARYFMGAPVTREHCIQILKDGYQRQRILAAHYLCLLQPGTPLFNTSAPAWRQQKLLAQMA